MRQTRETRLQLKTMVMAVITVVMMVLVVGMTTLVSHAEEGKVTATSVKIRESADTNSEMLSGAMQGDILTITGEVTGADGKIWYQVTFEGNRTGYVRSDLMEKVSGSGTATTTAPASDPSTPASGVQAVQPVSAKVTGEQVRVRSDASTSGSIVTTVQKDVVLTITGTATDSEGKTWYQISYSDTNGQVTGFVRQDFVSVEGEIVPADQVPEETEDPGTEAPVQTEEPAAPEHKDFETSLEDDGWYLLDYTINQKYSIEEIFDTAEKYEELYNQSQAKLKSMKTIMIILVVVVILLALAATLLFFKIRDMMDAAYFEEVEQETIRKRQGQRTAARASMPTVGAGSQAKQTGGQQTRAAGGQTRTAGNSQARPAGSGQSRPAGSGQQSRAAGGQTRAAGSGQAKPAGSTQKPAGSQVSRPAQPTSKPAQTAARPTQSAAMPAAQSSAKPAQQPKNFMADDDEFEFEFLNWDGEEDN